MFPLFETGIVFAPHPASQNYYGQSIKILRDQYMNLTHNGLLYVPPNSLYVDMLSTPSTFTIIIKNARVFKHVDHTKKYSTNDSFSTIKSDIANYDSGIEIISNPFDNVSQRLYNDDEFVVSVNQYGNTMQYQSTNSSRAYISPYSVFQHASSTTFASTADLNENFDKIIKPPYEIKEDLKKIWEVKKVDVKEFKTQDAKDKGEVASSYASVVKKGSGKSNDGTN